MIYQLLDERITQALNDAYDPETGELLIPEEELFKKITQAEVDYDATVDTVASEIKNLRAEEAGVKGEKMSLADRQARIRRRIDWLERLEAWLVRGEKWSNSRHVISFRKSAVLVLDDQFTEWAEREAPGLLKVTVEPKKDEIKQAIKAGKFFEYAHIEEKQNIQVK